MKIEPLLCQNLCFLNSRTSKMDTISNNKSKNIIVVLALAVKFLLGNNTRCKKDIETQENIDLANNLFLF
jgi:hypothetical protein